MPDRQKHQQEVRSFLQEHFPIHDWDFSIPHGTGMETYFVQGNRQEYFVKLGAPVHVTPHRCFGMFLSGRSEEIRRILWISGSPLWRDLRL